MDTNRLTLVAALLALAGGVAAEARAQEAPAQTYPSTMLFELSGAYGLQVGETDYLPAGTPGDYQHPLANGPAIQGMVGVMVDPHVALFGAYRYTWATTVHGETTGVLDSVRGTVDYHTAEAGVRLFAPLEFGRLRGELAIGVAFPFHSRLEVQYGPALTQLPMPITGTGSRVSNYSVGIGGHAGVGYDLPLTENFYLGLGLQYSVFQSENSGETTDYTNFVTDYGATPPTAVTASVAHGDGEAAPHTYSVQDFRLHLSVGGGF